MSGKLRASGDYRTFVGAFPIGEITKSIQTLRQRYDAKTARITAPPVTLAGIYWYTGPAAPENKIRTTAGLQAIYDKGKIHYDTY